MIDARTEDDKPDREPPPGWRVVKVLRVPKTRRVIQHVDDRGQLVYTVLERDDSGLNIGGIPSDTTN